MVEGGDGGRDVCTGVKGGGPKGCRLTTGLREGYRLGYQNKGNEKERTGETSISINDFESGTE